MENYSRSTLLKEVTKLYPEHEKEINLIFHENEIFVELAEDYLFCKKTLECQLDNENDYRKALRKLENEILEQINVYKMKSLQ